MWIVAYVAGGARPLKESLSAMLVGKLNVDTLMVAAALGAAVLGDWVEGAAELRRTRVGAWRILFYVDIVKRVIEVRAIRPRGQAYRGL